MGQPLLAVIWRSDQIKHFFHPFNYFVEFTAIGCRGWHWVKPRENGKIEYPDIDRTCLCIPITRKQKHKMFSGWRRSNILIRTSRKFPDNTLWYIDCCACKHNQKSKYIIKIKILIQNNIKIQKSISKWQNVKVFWWLRSDFKYQYKQPNRPIIIYLFYSVVAQDVVCMFFLISNR